MSRKIECPKCGTMNKAGTVCECVGGSDQPLVRVHSCIFCGYAFDHELLGKYGCPNCAGETQKMSDVTPPTEPTAAKPLLRLWLPGYHTPSLNVTTGGHWKQYHGLKQKAARALLDVLKERPDIPTKTLLVVDAIAQGGKLGKRGELIRLGAKQEAARAKKAAGSKTTPLRALLKFTRVTCQPLDVENFCGSTKALTDCLRMAFPLWLPDDAPEFVEIIHKQERCRTRDETGTWVELRLTSSSLASST